MPLSLQEIATKTSAAETDTLAAKLSSAGNAIQRRGPLWASGGVDGEQKGKGGTQRTRVLESEHVGRKLLECPNFAFQLIHSWIMLLNFIEDMEQPALSGSGQGQSPCIAMQFDLFEYQVVHDPLVSLDLFMWSIYVTLPVYRSLLVPVLLQVDSL